MRKMDEWTVYRFGPEVNKVKEQGILLIIL